jgi:hypothetical protein
MPSATPIAADPRIDWLDGAIDLHVHAGPSFFPRWGDGPAVARACLDAGMRGVLLKAHEGSTVEAAAALSGTHAPLDVAGGVVLNRYVGGINPDAAEASVRLGGRCIWFPTIDSSDHVRAYGSTGAYDHQSGGTQDTCGLAVVDADGALTPPAREVLAIARDHDVCVATGHLSAQEIDRVLDAARDLGLRRVLVQHPCFATPRLDLDAVEHAVRRGACVELTYLSVSPMWNDVTIDRCVEVMRRVGSGSVVVSSDAGQPHNPSPPEALRSFAQSLHERGVPAADLRTALVDTPAELLGR